MPVRCRGKLLRYADGARMGDSLRQETGDDRKRSGGVVLMAGQPWTTSEIAYLMANFQRGQSRAVAEALRRSQTSVCTKYKKVLAEQPKLMPVRVKPKRRIPPGVRDWLLGYVAE